MRSSHLSKTLVALSVAASLMVLGACGDDSKTAGGESSTSAKPSASAKPTPSPSKKKEPVKPSSNFDKVKVSGEYGTAPKITVAKPWGIDKTQAKVLKESKGNEIKEGTSVEVNYLAINGRTGVKFDDSYSRKQTASFPLDNVVPGFAKGLIGQREGSRVLIAMTGKDGYDAQGGNPQAGIEVGDTLIFVVDVVSTTLDEPKGTDVKPVKGLPTVKDKKGTPTVTIPKTDPPKKLTAQPLIKGKGKKVADGDQVSFRYSWVTWSDGKVVEQNYGKTPAASELGGLVPGLAKGLVGQTVGSRVLLVVPPADGYPNGNAKPKIGKNETLVFVVDVLFTMKPLGQ